MLYVYLAFLVINVAAVIAGLASGDPLGILVGVIGAVSSALLVIERV